MSQTVMSAECIIVAVVNFLLAFYLIRAERVYNGVWFPWYRGNISLGWIFAIYCLCIALIFIAIALTALARPNFHVELWALLLVTATGASAAALFMSFAQAEMEDGDDG